VALLCGARFVQHSLVSFFKELPVVLNKLRPWLSEAMPDGAADAVDSVLRLREWQETLTSLTHLASKYKVRAAAAI
jgi:hypothetical protein